MFLMYLCFGAGTFERMTFSWFHTFYMCELPAAPGWNLRLFNDIGAFVVRTSDLHSDMASTVDQIRAVTERLVELFEAYVIPVMAFVHAGDATQPQGPDDRPGTISRVCGV